MLEDRDYMRASDYGVNRWRTATAVILILNAVVFLIETIAPRLTPSAYLGLSWAGLKHGYIWQLLTFQFLHAGPLHLILNSLGLFSFGFAVELFLGTKRFVWLYLASGAIGGLVHVLGQILLPGVMGQGVVVGASAGLFGLIAAFALMSPEQDLTAYILFAFPITVSAKVLANVFLGISVLGVIIEATGIGRSSVAHGAHAGGMLGGWLMLRWFSRQSQYTGSAPSKIEAAEEKLISEAESLQKQVDAILDKIHSKGIHSLSSAERKMLDAYQKKINQR